MRPADNLKRADIYRDTNTLYNNVHGGYSKMHLKYCNDYAGHSVLDIGCATGNLCIELQKNGYKCTGVDINSEYVRIAKENGVEAYVVDGKLPFEDKAFDTVTIFEVLEHIKNPNELLKEAKRVARKNILISVPNCGGYAELKKWYLTYEHFLELDHRLFFTKESLRNLLVKHFNDFIVTEEKPVFLGRAGLPWWISKPIALLYKLRVLKPKIFTRLFAVINFGADG